MCLLGAQAAWPQSSHRRWAHLGPCRPAGEGDEVTDAVRDAHFSTQRPGLGIVCFLRLLQATEWGYLWGSDLIFP